MQLSIASESNRGIPLTFLVTCLAVHKPDVAVCVPRRSSVVVNISHTFFKFNKVACCMTLWPPDNISQFA